MKKSLRVLCALVVLELIAVLVSVPARASVGPVVSGLSTHHGTYWGGMRVTVHGQNFTQVRAVLFGKAHGYSAQVVSASTITVRVPWHDYATVHVRVITSAGTSPGTTADRFAFTRPTMSSPIQGGLTGWQEQRISAKVRAAHHGVHVAPAARGWSAAMGVTALRRARSWLGLPYSWAGGNGARPTTGVCAHNGGDLDCHIIGFDCSGLAMHAWWPYRHLIHYAATQHSRAGRFHPSIGQLMPGDLVFFAGSLHGVISHVAVYEGRGMVIQAAESGTVIMRSRLTDVIANSGVYRGATRPASTGRQAAVPRLSSMTAQLPTKGGYVTITGSHLGTATTVSVGGTLLYSFARRSYSRLVVKVPAHRAGAVSVAVSNPWGTARRTITYVGAPTISSLSPADGPVAGGNPVTVSGLNLAWTTKATVGGASVRFVVTAGHQVVVTMPAHPAAVVPVTLYSRFGPSNPTSYTYVDPAPPPPAPPASSVNR